MWRIAGDYILHTDADLLYVCSMSNNKTFVSSALSEPVGAALHKPAPNVTTSFGIVENKGGVALNIERITDSGLELKPLTVDLVRNSTSLAAIVSQLVTDRNEMQVRLLETQHTLANAQSALDVMVAEKTELQENALKCISSILEERNRILNENK